MMHPDVNDFWSHVKSQYPDARFEYWIDGYGGELLFYPNARAEEEDKDYSCVWRNRQFLILTEF